MNLLTHFDENEVLYNGEQMQPLRSYLKYGLLGDSVVSWMGPCQVSFEHMLDGEDLREQSSIAGDKMLHFVFELFDVDLSTGVAWQRIVADLIRDLIQQKTNRKFLLNRIGDDLYWQGSKFSISIATPSVNSVLVHYAVNVVSSGAPVNICSLADFSLNPKDFAMDTMSKLQEEWRSIRVACYKVKAI